eukprot:CAMPEP_0119300670 /NCGR_PEP_ID=MMETSP1333-20130426/2575_1 /TAXON_ID=418940 /ORGANISM="Scyphosphaera apsteinii, Strain RCC1455" /LENGTH=437 /DNA_ID=CAMNT_0007302517 /DNA_START=14 /DNA_END=1327 /DNA_ORIENTATION=-
MSAWKPPPWAVPPPNPDLVLEQRKGDQVLHTFELSKKRCFILGRQPGVADILIENDEAVSRQHAALVPSSNSLYLYDLKSFRGTYHNRSRVKPDVPQKLAEGSEIALSEGAPTRFVVRGLRPPVAPAVAPPPAAASKEQRWKPPAWAVIPNLPVEMELQRGGAVIQTLDVSRKAAYVLGRNGQQADLVVPHDSVSRQHAALVHGAQGPSGSASVHILDLNSTKGTYIEQSSGWKKLSPNAPTLLPPGGRVRLGDCSTLLVYQTSTQIAAAPIAAAAEDAPRFSSLLQSTVVSATAPGRSAEPPSEQDADGANSEAVDLAAKSEPDDRADGEGTHGADLHSVEEPSKSLSNSDLRDSLLPFLQRRPELERDASDGNSRKKKKPTKGRDEPDSDDESDAEPEPPMVLDKTSLDLSGGLVLRKQKVKTGKKESKSLKIKF